MLHDAVEKGPSLGRLGRLLLRLKQTPREHPPPSTPVRLPLCRRGRETPEPRHTRRPTPGGRIRPRMTCPWWMLGVVAGAGQRSRVHGLVAIGGALGAGGTAGGETEGLGNCAGFGAS